MRFDVFGSTASWRSYRARGERIGNEMKVEFLKTARGKTKTPTAEKSKTTTIRVLIS